MASIPGARFDLTGASGSQGLLSPKSGWFSYVFPRGAYAAQDSTGTLITFDSADAAARFSANDWIQSGLSTDNIRQVSAVGGDSMSISGAAMTVSANDRIFLIGTTQPTVTGGSATYTTPNTLVRQRADDTATLYSNSMITSDSNGLNQFFGTPALYDVMIQDGNQANQGFIAELELGTVQGISLTDAITFGATVTVSGTLIGTAGVSFEGPSSFGTTVTMHGTLGVTGTAVFGTTVNLIGTSGNYTHVGTAIFGDTVTLSGALGVTGAAVFDSTVTINNTLGVTGDVEATGGYRSYLMTFARDNVAANLSLAGMVFGGGSGLHDTVAMPRAGSITGLAAFCNAAPSGGTATVTVFHNGAAVDGLSTTIGTGNTRTNSITQAKDTTTFAANDEFTCRLASTSDWSPTTSEINAVIEIET